MTIFDSATLGWLLVGCFGGAIVSALVPWVNAEILLLAALPLATMHEASVPLIVVVALGQMVGKSVVYWLSREAVGRTERVLPAALEKWRKRFARHPRSAVVTIAASALVGFPPFYVVSIVAGALRISFAAFLLFGGVGRLAHFALIAAVPRVISF